MTLILLFTMVCCVYAAIAYVISRGIHNRYSTRKDTPFVSVVIPARNEAHTIGTLLESLLAADYPPDRLEIIVINDQSEDRTRQVAEECGSRFACQFAVYDVVDEPDGKLTAKTRPLAQGLDRATGEIILMTDADCTIPPAWIRTITSYFTPDVGMVCGMTLPKSERQPRRWLTRFETLDWLFLLGSSAGLSGRRSPQALIGNNYSVRRETYLEIGTFRALPFTDIDDLVLLQAVKLSRWKVVYPADAGALIYTRPLNSVGELIRQRRRWMKGSTHVPWPGSFVIAFGILTHITWPLWPLWLGASAGLPLAAFFLGDAFVLLRMMRRYRQNRLLWITPFYPAFAFAYGLGMLALLLTSRRVRWKNRNF